MSQIIRAFMIDSISAGRSMELAIEGNTSVSGQNGSGKTTIIKINPFFYGAKPSSISARMGNVTLSFPEFYLPRQSSYVVFEYRQGDRNCCMVAYSNDVGSSKAARVIYHLIDAPYDESWFLEKQGEEVELVLNSDFRRKLEAKGIYCSQKMGVNQYKSIILNGVRSREGTMKDQRILNELKSRFSIAPSGIDLTNVGDICHSVIKRVPSLDSIKESLETILINDYAISDDNLKLNIKDAEIGNWLDGYSVISGIKTQDSNIAELNGYRLRVDNILTNLSNYYHLCVGRKSVTQDLYQKAKDKAMETSNKITASELLEQNLNNELSSKIGLMQADLEQQEFLLRRINADKDGFESKDIPRQRSLATEVESTAKIYEDSIDSLNKLTEGVQSLYEFFANEKSLLDNEIAQFSNQSEKQLILLGSNASISQDEERVNGTNKIALAMSNQKLRRDIVITTARTSSETLAQIKGRLHQLVNSPEMLKDIDDQQIEINKSQLNLKEEEKELHESREIYNKEKTQLDNLLSQLSNINLKISVVNKDYDDTQSLYSPEKGTLIGFLRDNNIPNWEENIAKTINPDLLNSKLLSPSMDKDESLSLFGVNIDLSSVESPSFASLEVLDKKLAELSEKKELLLKNKSTIDSLIKSSIKAKKEFDSDVSHKKYSVKAAEDILEQDTLELKELKERAKIELAKYKEDMAKELAIAEKNKRIADKNYADFEKDCDSEIVVINQEIQKNIARINRDLATKKSMLKDTISIKMQKFEESKESIDVKMNDALKEQNLDPDQIRLAEEKTIRNKDKMRLCEKAVEIVQQYEQFIKDEWIKSDSFIAAINKIKIEISKTNTSYDKEISIASKNNAELRVLISELNKESSELLTETSNLETLETRLNIFHLPIKTISLKNIHNYSYLHQESFKNITEMQSINDKGASSFKNITKVFVQFSNTGSGEYYKTAESEAQTNMTESDLGLTKWYFMSEKLHNFMDTEIHNQISLLNTATKNHCIHISDFAISLIECHTKIGEIGRKLTMHANKVVANFSSSSITALEIKISSQMDQLGYWLSIQEFQKAYNNWLSLGDNDTPPKELLKQLETLRDIVKTTGLNVSIKESFSLEISIIDQGDHKVARNDNEITALSSRGLSYLVVLLIYTSVMNLLRGSHDINITWAIDELKDLDRENAKEIVRLLNENKITLICAYPDADPDLLEDYKNAYSMKPGRILCTYNPGTINDGKDTINNLIKDIQSEGQDNA